MSDLPNGWKQELLSDYLETIIDYRGKTPEKADKGILTLSAKSVKMGEIDYSQAYFISKETYKEFMVRGFPKIGDILMTTEAPLGCIAKLDRDDVSVAQRLLTLRGKEGQLDNDYLMYYLMSPVGQYELLSRASGSTVQGIKRSEFEKINIILPNSYSEQKQIANILSSFDKKIELLKEQNQTLETMAQTIFKEWFVDFNYPNATGEMIDSEMGEIPKGWEIIQVDNLFDVRDGTHDSPKQTLNGKYLITSKHILNFKLDIENAYLISEEDFFNINKRSLVEENDILFSMIGTIGLTYVEQSSNINYAIKNIALFKTSQNMEWVYYMYIWLSGEKGQDFIVKHKTGSTQQYISLSSLRNIKIIKPSNEILIYFNNFVRPIFNKIKMNTSQIQTLEETKDSLLPKLMSGKIRIQGFNID